MRPLAYSNAKNGTKCRDYLEEFSYAVFWGFLTQLNFKTMKTITSFPRKVKETPNIFIKLKDGTQLAARIWMPVDAEKNPVPAILEYLPYRKRDGTIVRDALTHPYFAGHGYASIRVDMRGNGDSDGLMHDEYTEQELADAEEVIEWLAKQSWCTGKVGMMGISWGGFNGLQVAERQPKALKAVVTLCSTDDRYTDDIHYKGGCLLGENMGWSATMLAYSSRSPDPEIVGKKWKKMWLNRLENEPLLAIDWLEHPHRDAYWKHGSINENYKGIKAAVLAVGGWNDAYSNAVPRLVSKIKAPVKGIIGPWAHKYPHFAVPEPRIGFLQEALRWWDQYLKGQDTGVSAEPAFRTYIMDLYQPGASVAHIAGRWVNSAKWPSNLVQTQRYYLQAHGLSQDAAPNAQSAKHATVCSPQNTGKDSGEFCVIWLGPEFPGDQRHDDSGSLTFDSTPLTKAIDLVGAPVLNLQYSSDKPVANIAVRLNAVWPNGAVSRVSYQVLNLCHQNSHENPQALEPGKTYKVKIALDDTAVSIPAGCQLRVSISTAYWPLIWPSPEAATLKIALVKSSLDLPIRLKEKNEVAPEFAPAQAAKPVKLTELEKPKNSRTIEINQATGETVLKINDNFGRYVIDEHGLEYASCGREKYSIMPNDPLSAVQECHWTEENARGNWRVRTETFSKMTATKTHWHITGRLEAYESDKLIYSKEWNKKIKRQLA